MAKIAVTGANGRIGRRVCDDLAPDHEVIRIDLTGTPAVDMCDLDALEKAVAGAETLIHLARIPGGVRSGWDVTQRNMLGTYNAFEAARRNGCKRVIFASSNHAVGMYEVKASQGEFDDTNGKMLLRPEVAMRPDGLYGLYKCFGEVLGRYYSDEYGIQVACVRIGSVREHDSHVPEDLSKELTWMNLTDEEKLTRLGSTWLSKQDFARLVRCILDSDVPYGVCYGISDNASRFLDLEAGRAIYGWWPTDGVK